MRFLFLLSGLDQKVHDCRGLYRASNGRDLTGPDCGLTVIDSVHDAVDLRTTDADLTVTGSNRNS